MQLQCLTTQPATMPIQVPISQANMMSDVCHSDLRLAGLGANYRLPVNRA